MIYQLALLPKATYSFFHKLAGIALFFHRVRLRVKRLIAYTDSAAELVKESWMLFVEFVNKLQATGAWRLEAWQLGAQNWQEYCRKRWNIDPSRISQFRSALPYAMALKNAGQDNLLEATIRKIKKARIPADSPLLPAAYELALEVARDKGKAPTEAMFRRAHEILQVAENTGYVNVGEMNIPIKDVASAVFAVKVTMKEAVDTALEGKSIKLKVQAKKVMGNTYRLEFNGKLPDNFEFIVYVKEKGKTS